MCALNEVKGMDLNMKRIVAKTKSNILNQKKKYLFLSIILLIGVVSGLLFILFIDSGFNFIAGYKSSQDVEYLDNEIISLSY